jgi:hypothetical protein
MVVSFMAIAIIDVLLLAALKCFYAALNQGTCGGMVADLYLLEVSLFQTHTVSPY